MQRPPLILALTCTFLVVFSAPAIAATSAADPTGDNCADACGPDLTGAADQVDLDGTVHVSITRASSICNTISYPALEVQPLFQILSASATAQTDTSSYLGSVWAVSTTSNFNFSPQTGGADTAIVSTVLAGSVEVVIPFSVISSLGGLPLKWFVNDSCKEFPFDPPTSYKDFAPNSGLYTLDGIITDVCTNLPDDQATVPAGMVLNAGGCVPLIVVNGTAAAETLLGNLYANVMNGFAGNDKLYGRAGNDTMRGGADTDKLFGEAGNDRLFGDAGMDVIRGGAGKDKHYGGKGNDTLDGRDHKGGDVINGGAGNDVCYYNKGDTVTGCEKTYKRA